MARALVLGAAALVYGAVAGATDPGNLRTAADTNPDPHVVEFDLVAAETTVDLDGAGLAAHAYTFNGAIPGPEIRLKVSLGLGKGRDRVLTCDLTKEYIAINGDYRS